jgi:hypothetical protein
LPPTTKGQEKDNLSSSYRQALRAFKTTFVDRRERILAGEFLDAKKTGPAFVCVGLWQKEIISLILRQPE